MKKVLTILAIIVGYFTFTNMLKDDKKLIENKIHTIASFSQIEKKIPLVQAGLKSQKFQDHLSEDFTLIYEKGDYKFKIDGKNQASSHLVYFYSKVKEFDYEVMQLKTAVSGTQAMSELTIGGQGNIPDYQEYFSEQRTVTLNWSKVEDDWKLKRITLIEQPFP